MARTFNRAYDQADRILNGSGLSSIVYRQGAGRIVTDTLKRVPTYAKNYLKGVANKIWYDLTGEPLSDTTREDMTKGEAAALEEGIAEAVVTGKGEFGNLGTEFEDWVGLGEKGNVRRDAEAIVGGASVSWNPKTGEYGFKDKYDFPVYEAPGKFKDEVESINAWLEERGNRRDQIVDPTGGLGGILIGNFFPQNRQFGIGLGLGSRSVGKSENVPYFDEKTGKHTTRHVPYAGAFHTSMGISPQEVQDISEKHDFFGVLDPLQKVKTHTGGTGSGFGLVGGDLSVRAEPASSGYSYDPDTDTTSLDGAAIDTTSGLKHGGQTMSRGLSGINKTININGQPHSLAWINPGEASALRAMGGSGRKVEGIPAYFDEWSMGGAEAEQQMADVYADVEGAAAPAPVEYDYKSPAYQQSISPEAQADLGSATTYQDGVTWRDPYPDKDKGPAGGVPYYGGSDPLTTEDIEDGRYSRNLIPFYNALKETGMTNAEVAAYLSGMGPAALSSMRESYDTGYSFGGPMGTMRGLGREQGTDYAKKLKLKEFAKELKDLKDKNLSQKDFDKQKGILFSKYQDMAKDLGATITEGKRFKSMYSDIPATAAKQKDSVSADIISGAYDWNLLPGQAFAAGLAGVGNALTGLFGVVGGFTTPDGKSFSLMDDGTLVEPDIYADTDEGNIERQPISRLPPPVVQPATLEPELTGIAALQAERPEVASVAQSLQPQFDNLASIFGREKAAEFLNQPVNIFA